MFVDLNTIRHLWPEAILVLCAAWIYLGGAFRPARGWWTGFALVSYLLALVVLMATEVTAGRGWPASGVASGPIVVDALGSVFRGFALFVGSLFAILAYRGSRHELHSEYQGTLMLLTAGLMVVARANNLVLMFVGLELISIPTYILLFLGRRERSTAEATLKYFYLSILSSALLLYGFSFLYGLTGTTTLRAIGGAGADAPATLAQLGIDVETLKYLALVLIVAGLGFRLAAVPFHFYAPDVYQGVTNVNAGLLAVVPKIAGVLAVVRILLAGFPAAASLAWELLLVLAVLTMTLGNVCALWQQNIRRLLAYSSIAHAGYLLIGLAVAFANQDQAAGVDGGLASALVYVFVYSLAALGSFAALAYLSGERQELNSVDELAGLAWNRPVAAAALVVCMFSLAGLPPLAGFWGKLVLFFGAVQTATASTTLHVSAWFLVLVTAGAINAAIGAAYYLRVIATMFFRTAIAPPAAEGGWSSASVMLTCTILLVALGLWPGPMLDLARDAERAFQTPIVELVDRAATTQTALATPPEGSRGPNEQGQYTVANGGFR